MMPSIPSRPRSDECENGGGLVSSRVKAFAGAAVKSPPPLPAKPNSIMDNSASTSKNIHQMVKNFDHIQRAATYLDKTDSKPPKLPPSLPKSPVIRQAAQSGASDFSIKDTKSKLEAAMAVSRKISQPISTPAARSIQKSRPISEFCNFGDNNDDFNNNTAKVKNIRAELESKLTLWTPTTGGPPQLASRNSIGPNNGDAEINAERQSYQQTPLSIIQHGSNDHRLPASSSYPEGFQKRDYSDERPILPTLSAKSKPPPRPPPCSLTTKSSQPGNHQWGQNAPSNRMDYSRTPSPQESTALVAYDFFGEQSDELASRRGDSLILKHELDDEWYYAYNTRTGRTGIIPKGFVDVKVPLPMCRHTNPNSDEDSGIESSTDGPRCYTLHDFVSNVAGDLTFLKGEVIKLISRVNDDWLEGESHDGRRGIFPVSFVEIIENLPSASNSPTRLAQSPPSQIKTDDTIVTGLYDFRGENPGDLSFLAGSKIHVLGRVNDDWVYGKMLDNDQLGIFPTTFVDHVPSNLPFYDSNDAY